MPCYKTLSIYTWNHKPLEVFAVYKLERNLHILNATILKTESLANLNDTYSCVYAYYKILALHVKSVSNTCYRMGHPLLTSAVTVFSILIRL